jgi:hypothetical protein
LEGVKPLIWKLNFYRPYCLGYTCSWKDIKKFLMLVPGKGTKDIMKLDKFLGQKKSSS